MKIIKHSGDIVDFNPEKLRTSLLKSGAGEAEVQDILEKISSQIYEGISTKKIYKMAFAFLKKTDPPNAARYNLKTAIQLLGPAGFFFEKYIARLFAAENYQTKTNLILQGKCVNHEIDVMVKKDEVISMIECKFHMGSEGVSDVKIPMYVLSRFNDLKEVEHKIFTNKDTISKCWIVNNSRFTSDAIDFAKCYGLNLLSWDYPPNNNLKTKNDNDLLYPITCLTTLSTTEKDKLLVMDVILVRELLHNFDRLSKIGISENRKQNVMKEVAELCKSII